LSIEQTQNVNLFIHTVYHLAGVTTFIPQISVAIKKTRAKKISEERVRNNALIFERNFCYIAYA